MRNIWLCDFDSAACMRCGLCANGRAAATTGWTASDGRTTASIWAGWTWFHAFRESGDRGPIFGNRD